VQALLPEWKALADQALEPNAFNEHWLLLPAVAAYDDRRQVRFAAVRVQGRLAALFPFERVRSYKRLPLHRLKAWRHRHALVSTPLLRAGEAAPAFTALFRWLATTRSAPPLLQLDYVPGDGAFHDALQLALRETGSEALTLYRYERSWLRRDRDADSYLASALSAKGSKKLDRCEAALRKTGAMTVGELRPGDQAGTWIEDFIALEASGWKGRGGSALACRPVDREFGTLAFQRAIELRRLHAVRIDVDSRPIAMGMGFLAGDGAAAFKVAYDERWSRYAPGILIEREWIRRFHALPGPQWMDSLAGPDNEVLKRLWKHSRPFVSLMVGAGGRGRRRLALLKALLWVKHSFS